MRKQHQAILSIAMGLILTLPDAALAQDTLQPSKLIRYSGSFTNTTYGLRGEVQIDLTFESNDAVSGYINFTNYPNTPTLCGAGRLTGLRQGKTLQIRFVSSDSDPGCGFDRGWIFTVSATLSSDNTTLENGTYQVETRGKGGGRGVFTATSQSSESTTGSQRVSQQPTQPNRKRKLDGPETTVARFHQAIQNRDFNSLNNYLCSVEREISRRIDPDNFISKYLQIASIVNSVDMSQLYYETKYYDPQLGRAVVAITGNVFVRSRNGQTLVVPYRRMSSFNRDWLRLINENNEWKLCYNLPR